MQKYHIRKCFEDFAAAAAAAAYAADAYAADA